MEQQLAQRWHYRVPQGPPQDEHEVYVRFANKTERALDLYWKRGINGSQNMQLTLKPDDNVNVNTYNTHIWSFRDYHTGEVMNVNSKQHFHPVRIRIARDPEKPNDLINVRTQISIHFPMRSLKDNCLWLLLKWLRNPLMNFNPRECIDSFLIPATLKTQLLETLDTIETYNSQAHLSRMRILERMARR